jgi:ribosomal protein S18 acetylase RimI-like enzyme
MARDGAETGIRPAGPADAGALNAALAALSAHMGDPHRADAAALAEAMARDDPPFRALLAEAGGEVVGAAMFSPMYSTVKGGAGVYVSDLWVAAAARGTGLGRRLLGAAAAQGRRRWGARYLKLSVYDDNPQARAAYDRMGFSEDTGARWLTLQGDAWQSMGEDA